MASKPYKAERRNGGFLPLALRAVVLLCCVALAIVSYRSPRQLDDLRHASTSFFAPVIWLFSVPVETVSSIVSTGKSYLYVHKRNAELEAQLKALTALSNSVERLALENRQLKRQLSVSGWPSRVVASARVLSYGGGTYLKSILASGGSSAGIESGHAAVTNAGFVGQVVAVSERMSRVLLISDFSSRLPVVIDETMTPAIAEGNNTQTLSLNFLPIDFSSSEGARVSTSGAGGLFPAGIPVGRVVILSREPEMRYGVVPFADLSRIGTVTFLKPQPADPPIPQTLPKQFVDPNLSAQAKPSP